VKVRVQRDSGLKLGLHVTEHRSMVGAYLITDGAGTFVGRLGSHFGNRSGGDNIGVETHRAHRGDYRHELAPSCAKSQRLTRMVAKALFEHVRGRAIGRDIEQLAELRA